MATPQKWKHTSCSFVEVIEGILKTTFLVYLFKSAAVPSKYTPEISVCNSSTLGLCSHTERRKINFNPQRMELLVQKVTKC